MRNIGFETQCEVRARRCYIRARMQLIRREQIKWTVSPGLVLALLMSLSEVIVRWVHIDQLFPLLDDIERPLRWIEQAIWARQWTFYTPYDHSQRPTRLACIGSFLGLVDIGAIRCWCLYWRSRTIRSCSYLQESRGLSLLGLQQT